MLAHGFDPHEKGSAGDWAKKTPLDLAREHEHLATIAVLEHAMAGRRRKTG